MFLRSSAFCSNHIAFYIKVHLSQANDPLFTNGETEAQKRRVLGQMEPIMPAEHPHEYISQLSLLFKTEGQQLNH